MALWTEGPLTVLPSLSSFLIPETKTCLSSPQWESLPVFMTSSAHNSHSGNLSILLLPQAPRNSGTSCIFKLIQILMYVFKVMLKHLSGKKSEESYY